MSATGGSPATIRPRCVRSSTIRSLRYRTGCPPLVRTHVACRPDQHRASECGRTAAAGRARSYWRSSSIRGANHGATRERFARPAAISFAVIRHVRRLGSVAGVHRHLWRAGVLDQSARAGNRYSHGARSHCAQRCADGAWAESEDDILRGRNRYCCRLGGRPMCWSAWWRECSRLKSRRSP